MKTKSKLKYMPQIKRLALACLVVIAVGGIGVVINGASRAASSSFSLYLSPATATYSVGNTFTLSIRENSGSTGLVGVQANLTYPQSELKFDSINTSTSAFPTGGPANVGGGGTATVDMFAAPPGETGDQEVADISFTVLAAGSAQVEFAGSSQVGDTSGNLSTPTTTGGTYTAQTPTCPSGQTGTPPNCVTPTCPSGQTGTPPNCVTPTPAPTPPVSTTTPTSKTPSAPTASKSSTSASSGSPATSYTPAGVSTPAVVPNNSQVALSSPTYVAPATTSSLAILKVEYLLNTQLIATVDMAPFTYKLNTRNILNGTYTFTTTTFYVGGKTSSASQKLIVKNPISLTQVRLAAQKYSLPIIIPIVLIVAIIFLLRSGMFRNIHTKGKGQPPTSGIKVGADDSPSDNPTPTIASPWAGSDVTNPALKPSVYTPETVYKPHSAADK